MATYRQCVHVNETGGWRCRARAMKSGNLCVAHQPAACAARTAAYEQSLWKDGPLAIGAPADIAPLVELGPPPGISRVPPKKRLDK